MAEINLFSYNNGVTELVSTSVGLEKELQILIEQNMLEFFGVTFLKSEYAITNGRIDSLGLDENNCPVIFEYKRSVNENVINQGLFYLDWLLDHKADFKLLVMDALGIEKANSIDWSFPCVFCIASDFTKYDEHAVNQMQRNIKLVRYKKYGNDLLLFEHLNSPRIKLATDMTETAQGSKGTSDKTFLQQYASTSKSFQNLFETIKDYILSLGDDITVNQLKYYVAFKKVKNIVCIEMTAKTLNLSLKLRPDDYKEIIDGSFIRDMRNVGHWGTGDLQVTVKNAEDFEKAKHLIDRAYNEN